MYKVIKMFTDLQDNSYAYHAGDTFPRDGVKVTQERLDELSSNKNRRRVALIKKIEDPKPKVEETKNIPESKAEAVEVIPEPEPEIMVEPQEESKPVKSTRKNKGNKNAE